MNTKFSVAAFSMLLVAGSVAALGINAGVRTQVRAGSAEAGVQTTVVATTTGQSRAMMLRIETGKDRANREIDRRIESLNTLSTNVSDMQRVTADEKTNLTASIQSQITALTNLKTKIAGDTDITTLKADIKSITDSYRIYLVVIPQGHVAATADASQTAVNLLSSLAAKLETRLTAATQAGTDVSGEMTVLTDMKAKIADAQTQAQAAISVTANLQPDNGDKTVMQNNKDAFMKARSDLKAAREDLKTARQDGQKIIVALQKIKVESNTTTTTGTTTEVR